MKICLIADSTSVHTQRWAQYFIQKGDEVHLITYEPSSLDYSGAFVHIIKSPFESLYLSFIPRHLKIYLLVRKLKPDIVHAHFISKFGFHAAFLGFSPVIMSAWGDDILIIPYWSRFLWYFTKISLKRADLIYAASEDIRNNICSKFHITASKVKVNTHGVDVNLFYSAHVAKSEDKTIILSNRNFYPVYNLETLIESISIVVSEYENVFFLIIGQGPDEKLIKRMVLDKNLSAFVKFIGWCDSQEMSEYLNSADIYVSTSISDGTPVSMLEAMACGLPCVMTDVGGIHEWIDNGVTGLLVPPRKPEVIAKALLSLINDVSKRNDLGRNARRLILEKADKSKIMDEVLIDYKSLAKKRYNK